MENFFQCNELFYKFQMCPKLMTFNVYSVECFFHFLFLSNLSS